MWKTKRQTLVIASCRFVCWLWHIVAHMCVCLSAAISVMYSVLFCCCCPPCVWFIACVMICCLLKVGFTCFVGRVTGDRTATVVFVGLTVTVTYREIMCLECDLFAAKPASHQLSFIYIPHNKQFSLMACLGLILLPEPVLVCVWPFSLQWVLIKCKLGMGVTYSS